MRDESNGELAVVGYEFGKGEHSKSVARWKRTAFFDPRTGEVYVPAILSESSNCEIAAMHDGTALVLDGGHSYYPVSWMMREYPDSYIGLNGLKIIDNVKRAHFETEGSYKQY